MTSGRVLTMEFCEGGRADDLDYMIENDIPVEEVMFHHTDIGITLLSWCISSLKSNTGMRISPNLNDVTLGITPQIHTKPNLNLQLCTNNQCSLKITAL